MIKYCSLKKMFFFRKRTVFGELEKHHIKKNESLKYYKLLFINELCEEVIELAQLRHKRL